MEKLMKFLVKELTKEPQPRKQSLQEFAKRMLIGFFVLMLLLTILSRAADSIMIAKVNTAMVNSGILSFEVAGEGTIEAEAEKYIDLYQGIRIADIAVKEGQSVEEGEPLFIYDLQDLKAARESLQMEYTTASLNLQKSELGREMVTATSEAQAAKITLKRAELDYSLAKLELDAEKADIRKEKKAQLEAARASFSEIEEAKEEAEEGKDQAVLIAKKEVAEAEQALQELYQDKNKVVEVIAAFQTAVQNSTVKLNDMVVPADTDSSTTVNTPEDLFFDEGEYSKSLLGYGQSFDNMLQKVFTETISKTTRNASDPVLLAQKSIFMQYYGEEGYSSHAEEVHLAQKNLARAKEDYMLAFISATEAGGLPTTNQKAACIREYEDANATLQKLTRKDRELNNAILAYGIALQSNEEADITNTYHSLFSLLYQEDETKQKEINDAIDEVAVAQQKLTWSTSQWDRKLTKLGRELKKAQEKLSEAQEIYDQIKNQSYDYGADLKEQERQVRNAERSLEDAKTALKIAERRDGVAYVSDQANKRINQIDIQINELELQRKKKALEELDYIIEQQGQVCSPVSGMLLHSNLVVGSPITGAEKVSVSLENFSFHVMVGKEEAKHLTAGDEIKIALEDGRRQIETMIESVGPVDEQGLSELTAILPEGDYRAGATAPFTVMKKSKNYNQTLPLQAVRMDSNQVYYILVLENRNTSLGNEMIARRRNISVLEKDYQTAAIEAPIASEENIIVSSDKNIEEGDRARINEDNQ